MAVAADDAINLVWRDTRVVHGLLAGKYGVGAQGLVHGGAVPTPVHRGMPVPGHCDFAPVFPDPQTVFISSPGIRARRSHWSPFFITIATSLAPEHGLIDHAPFVDQ